MHKPLKVQKPSPVIPVRVMETAREVAGDAVLERCRDGGDAAAVRPTDSLGELGRPRGFVIPRAPAALP